MNESTIAILRTNIRSAQSMANSFRTNERTHLEAAERDAKKAEYQEKIVSDLTNLLKFVEVNNGN